MELKSLFRFRGRVNRSSYALVGFLGVVLKYGMDSFLCEKFLHRHWGIWNFLTPIGLFASTPPVSPDQSKFLFLLAISSIPFIWLGLAMTWKRLEDADLPIPLILLFFAPAINILIFFLLTALPSAGGQQPGPRSEARFLVRILPKSPMVAGLSASLAGAVVGSAFGWFLIQHLGNYGWTLFLAVPFFMGFLPAWLYCYPAGRSFSECAAVGLGSVVLVGVAVLAFAFDGIVCIMMAAPIAAAQALLGAYVAYVIQGFRTAESQSGAVFSLFLAIPLMAGGEILSPPPTPEFKTHTSIEIYAPPQTVWKHIISFPLIDEPLNPIFKLGISYPLEAKITGSGLSADRRCIFSSGAFREPILAWEEGKHFAFGVSQEPPLMKELSPYKDIHVRHLEDHDFKPERADFYLTALPGGLTRLDGYTTYQNRMWPGWYWRFWTDTILHQIHVRVFRQVKQLSERDQAIAATESNSNFPSRENLSLSGRYVPVQDKTISSARKNSVVAR